MNRLKNKSLHRPLLQTLSPSFLRSLAGARHRSTSSTTGATLGISNKYSAARGYLDTNSTRATDAETGIGKGVSGKYDPRKGYLDPQAGAPRGYGVGYAFDAPMSRERMGGRAETAGEEFGDEIIYADFEPGPELAPEAKSREAIYRRRARQHLDEASEAYEGDLTLGTGPARESRWTPNTFVKE